MPRIFNKKSRRLLAISGGVVGLWSAEILVVDRKGDSAAVFYEGDSVFYAGEDREDGRDGYLRCWIGDVSKADMIRSLALILRKLPDEMAFAADNISSDIFDQWAIDYLSMCVKPETSQDTALAEFLTCFPTQEIHLIFDLFGGFKDPALIPLAASVYELENGDPSEAKIYEQLVERFGPVSQVSWFKDVADYVRNELNSARSRVERRETKLRLKQDRLYGKAEDVANVEGLLARFGMDVPAGYLAHATLYPPPVALEAAVLLLGAWGEVEQSLPTPPTSADSASRKSSWFSADLIFLAWLMQGRQSSLLDNAKMLPPKTRDKLFAKLLSYANQGAIDLAKLENKRADGQAHYIALKIQKSQAEFSASLYPQRRESGDDPQGN